MTCWRSRSSQVGQRLRYEEGDWWQNECGKLGMVSISGLEQENNMIDCTLERLLWKVWGVDWISRRLKTGKGSDKNQENRVTS